MRLRCRKIYERYNVIFARKLDLLDFFFNNTSLKAYEERENVRAPQVLHARQIAGV